MLLSTKMVVAGIACAMALTATTGVAVIMLDPIPAILPGLSGGGATARPAVATPEPTGPPALMWGQPQVYDNGVTLIVSRPR
ncbi:MAG: hypothetical protein ACRDP8_09135, partial [Actinopolymorphaceae bacterium]